MSATLTPSRQDVALSALLEEFTDAETQRLVRGAIERALSQGRRLDELQTEARRIDLAVSIAEHVHYDGWTFRDGCVRCWREAEEQRILSTRDRQRLLLLGKAVAA